MKGDKHLVTLRNFSFWYPDGTQALRNIDLEVAGGEFLTIMGKNGAGKTTLCLSIVGIIPNIFLGKMDGEINIVGMVPSEHYVYEITKNVGIVLQDPESQIFTHSVFSEVTFAAENLGLPREDIIERTEWALDVVGLKGFEDRMPRYLSGGQKQRLVIAAALVTKPRVLVLDEPTSQLDPVGTREVLDTLSFLNREEDLTIIMTEHKTDEVLEVSERIVILDEGRIVEEGSPEDVFQDVSTLVNLELKPPEIAEFFWKMGRRGLYVDRYPVKIEDALPLVSDFLERDKVSLNTSIGNVGGGELGSGERILDARNVSFEYPSKPPVKALENVNLTVNDGEFVAIVGKNGSGKTTLMKCLFGLLKPTKGDVLFRGRNIHDFPARERAKRISLVLQNPDHQLFSLSVAEEIKFGLKNLGVDEAEIDKRVHEVLNLIGLEEYKDTHPFQLSFGDRKKLAVASIIALDPDIVVLDEPTTGQDYKGRLEICDLAFQLNQKGKTIIMVTHDMDLVARYARRMIIMNNGRIIFDGSVREGFTRTDLLREAGLMPPRITMFAQMLNQYGAPRDILSVDEMVSLFRVEAG